MATIVFFDGKTAEVPYDKAANIYQVLIGNKEPDNQEQSDYITTVKEVLFAEIDKQTKATVVKDSNRHARLEAIRKDPTLKGYAVFDAVRKVLTNAPKKEIDK